MDYPYKNVNIKENNSISIRRCAERGWGYFLFEKFSNFAQRNVNLKETWKITHVILFYMNHWEQLGGRKRLSQSDKRGTVCDFCDTVLKPNGVLVTHPISAF